MKKLLAIVMAAAMVLSMSVIASADGSAQDVTISYDAEAKTATVTISSVAPWDTYDVAIVSDAKCTGLQTAMDFLVNVKGNSAYTYSEALNTEATDEAGNTYAVVTGAGCDSKTEAPIDYKGEMFVLSYSDVEEGTEFLVVTGTSGAADVKACTVLDTLKAEIPATPEPTATPEATKVPDPTATPDAGSKATDAPKATTQPSNAGTVSAGKTADVAPIATMITLVVVAGVAIVSLKKKATN